ncbi:helix-turn-helix domain-containing protein [Haloglomus halophilum]|uniref:helix-turn-helix domain-containing protein n=1 Tax=Haloglomus halophilum TaxID=2962672 RepID=UPI0020C9DE46|nr:helix-turn-helix domain-containing protein [Haloglomus halophilum]
MSRTQHTATDAGTDTDTDRDELQPMRFVEFVIDPDEGGLHPTDKRVAEHPDLERELVHNINLLADGTASALYQLQGDLDEARAIVDDTDEVYSYTVSQTRDSIHAYVQFEPTDDVRTLLEVPKTYGIIPDFPFEFTSRGGIKLSVVGEYDEIRRAVGEVPSSFSLHLTSTGVYRPTAERLFAELTERQQETLKAAVEAGYYEDSREATYKDIAAALDRTDGTVGEHLRKVESKVMEDLVP